MTSPELAFAPPYPDHQIPRARMPDKDLGTARHRNASRARCPPRRLDARPRRLWPGQTLCPCTPDTLQCPHAVSTAQLPSLWAPRSPPDTLLCTRMQAAVSGGHADATGSNGARHRQGQTYGLGAACGGGSWGARSAESGAVVAANAVRQCSAHAPKGTRTRGGREADQRRRRQWPPA
jgi:hypothetical protein